MTMQIEKEKTWVYAIVRKDLPIEQIIVQLGHAALESGIHLNHDKENEPSSFIVLQVKDQKELEKAYDSLKDKVPLIRFHEPSWDYGFTSFASCAVKQEDRHLFKKYRLFKG